MIRICKGTLRAAASRGHSLVKSADADSVEYSRTLLHHRLDLTATLPHDPSAVWIGRFPEWRRSVGLNARPASGCYEFRLTAVVYDPHMQGDPCAGGVVFSAGRFLFIIFFADFLDGYPIPGYIL